MLSALIIGDVLASVPLAVEIVGSRTCNIVVNKSAGCRISASSFIPHSFWNVDSSFIAGTFVVVIAWFNVTGMNFYLAALI